jgi:HTH-type transcriptional regulator/antitoxin HigA
MSPIELQKLAQAWAPISGAIRVPRTEREYGELLELLDQLTDQVGEDESHPLASLMDVLGVLIENYEHEHSTAMREWLEKGGGAAKPGVTTAEIMRETRGEE